MITSIYDINPNYLVQIYGTDERGQTVNIVAACPEEFTLDVQSSWDTLMPSFNLASLLSSNHGGAASNILTATTGYNLSNSKFAMSQIWSGTSPITFNLPLIFFALSDAASEVIAPSQQLAGLTMPSEVSASNTGFSKVVNDFIVKAPGPTVGLSGSGSNGYSISLAIGEAYCFPSIIVKRAPLHHRAVYTKYGEFLTISVDVEISTSTIVTKEDFAKFFVANGGSTGQDFASSPYYDPFAGA